MPDAVTPAAGMVEARGGGGAGAPSPPRRVGRYELLFEIARGGMGTVWVGRLHGAHGFGRFVAIKALKRLDDGPEAHAQFLEEAKLTARIHHPSVVQTLELFDHEGEPFIAMDLVRGVSLARLLDRYADGGEQLAPEIAAWIAMQVAAGLHAAHELRDRQGAPLALVHRDVSPQNVLLSYDGRALVADFGIAKFRRESVATESGVVKGKFAYMSPEQARAQALDRRSDVFSLGIVLHEMLTGQRLYAQTAAADALIQIVSVRAPDVRAVRPEVPAQLAAIVNRCLEKDREARFATCEALRDALRGAIASIGRPVDDHRLAEAVLRFFRRDEHAMQQRLAALDTDGAVDLAKTLPVVDDTKTEVSDPPFSGVPNTAVRSVSVAIPMRRTSTLVLAIGGIAAVAAVVAVSAKLIVRGPEPVLPSGTPSVEVPPAVSTPTSARVPVPADTASVPIPVVASAPAKTAVTTARPAPKASRPQATPTATITSAPSAEPASSAKKGVPFKTL